MSYRDLPLIPQTALFRSLGISAPTGGETVKSLAEQGKIRPTETPTGRTMLSPSDGEIVFKEIIGE